MRAQTADRRDSEAPDEKCILVVDDEPDALDSMVELLEAEGYAAAGASNGEEALSLLRNGLEPSLLLVDLTMPRMDGWALCEALAADEHLAGIPVAIVTASASVDRLPARNRNAGFFAKPIDFARLLDTVRRICG